MRCGAIRWSVAIGLLALFASCAAPADAYELVLRPGGNGTFVGNDAGIAGGGSGALTLGLNFEHEPLLIVPETHGAFGYYAGDYAGLYGRALLGMRFGLALAVEPSFITRGGYGHNVYGAKGAEIGYHGGAFQTGLGLDYRIDRGLTFGGELLYDLFIDTDGNTTHALTGGISIAFWL